MSREKREPGFRVESLSTSRRWIAAASAINREHYTFHLMVEADITEVRRLMAEHRERAGERLSLTAYVIACFAHTLAEFPAIQRVSQGPATGPA